MTQPTFPDFFLIGAPKCGTTSLFSWLQRHPDSYLPMKEPNFFSPDVLDVRCHAGAAQSEADYLARLCPPEASGKLTGEATPKYLYSDMARARLAQEAERVRLIVLLRNPIDMAAAMHAQNVRQGHEPDPDFARAWARGPAVPDDKMTDYRFWGRPGVQLERYMNLFPRDRILVMLLEEEMRSDPAAAHAHALRFLGLSPQLLDSYTAENSRKSYRSPRLQGLSRRARRGTYAALARLGFKRQGTGILRVFDRLNGSRPGRTELAPTLRAAVAVELAEDARRIAACLGRDRLPWDEFDWTASSSVSTIGD